MARDVFIDRLKGYACFLVVLGHVLSGTRDAGIIMPGVFGYAETFIWTFHVALFLFLSGQVYTVTGGWKSKGTRLKFIKHKALNLVIPYVLFSAVYILINSLVSSANNHSTITDILFIWRSPIAQYWFLYALFFLFVIWAVLGSLKNWQITIAVVVLTYIVPALGGSFGFFEVVMYSALTFGLGTFVKIGLINRGKNIFKLLLVAVHIAIGWALIKFDLVNLPGIKEAFSVLGIYVSVLFISELVKLKPMAKFFDFINKYSFQTFLLHTIFTAGVRTVLLKINITQWYIHLPVGLAFGIGCSVIASMIATRIPILNMCFFPTKKFIKRCDKNAK